MLCVHVCCTGCMCCMWCVWFVPGMIDVVGVLYVICVTFAMYELYVLNLLFMFLYVLYGMCSRCGMLFVCCMCCMLYVVCLYMLYTWYLVSCTRYQVPGMRYMRCLLFPPVCSTSMYTLYDIAGKWCELLVTVFIFDFWSLVTTWTFKKGRLKQQARRHGLTNRHAQCVCGYNLEPHLWATV